MDLPKFVRKRETYKSLFKRTMVLTLAMVFTIAPGGGVYSCSHPFPEESE